MVDAVKKKEDLVSSLYHFLCKFKKKPTLKIWEYFAYFAYFYAFIYVQQWDHKFGPHFKRVVRLLFEYICMCPSDSDLVAY